MRRLTESQFSRLKLAGHCLGMVLIAVGAAAVFVFDNGLYFLLGFFLYWLLNYWLIRGVVESRYTEKNPRRENESQHSSLHRTRPRSPPNDFE